jgi:hypothetical protein
MTTKNNKVPRSTKTKLSDLKPRKDARGGGRVAQGGPSANPVAGPPGTPPGIYQTKKSVARPRATA